jgi:alkylhydroperoxidase family enzyme
MSSEFASTWQQYDLDEETRSLLTYAEKLTEAPAMIGDEDIEAHRSAGWDEDGIYEATALISLFNMTGRMEAVSGLPPDELPVGSAFPEGAYDGATSHLPA